MVNLSGRSGEMFWLVGSYLRLVDKLARQLGAKVRDRSNGFESS